MDHEGGSFRGGRNRARLGGHGRGRRVMGSSTAGRVGGDFNTDMVAFGLTDADHRVGRRRHRNSQFAGGGFFGRRGRRSRRA